MSDCLKLPIPQIPTLPSPLSISLSPPELPDLSFQFCCKLPPFPIPIPPIPIPGLVFLVAAGPLNAFITQINAYLNALPLKCPLE